MAQVFNPWKDPPSTNTLTGDLASFEINEADGPDMESESGDMPEMPEHMDAMSQAMQVIKQQSELITKLMATLGK